ncbi:hypothetical protein RugamoR57_37440 [Duganella caerulea]|uniref:hypothetical protein n=1 Tax=Duganella caerulea TaxID=2885762 RepID=UPI0030E7A341
MSFFSDLLGDVFDSVFAPACANDPCSSGYVENLGISDNSSVFDSSSMSDNSISSSDWTSAFGTQCDFQPAAESGGLQFGGTFDSFDSGIGGSSAFGNEW